MAIGRQLRWRTCNKKIVIAKIKIKVKMLVKSYDISFNDPCLSVGAK